MVAPPISQLSARVDVYLHPSPVGRAHKVRPPAENQMIHDRPAVGRRLSRAGSYCLRGRTRRMHCRASQFICPHSHAVCLCAAPRGKPASLPRSHRAFPGRPDVHILAAVRNTRPVAGHQTRMLCLGSVLKMAQHPRTPFCAQNTTAIPPSGQLPQPTSHAP